MIGKTHKYRQGFTLVEMTVVIVVSLMVATITLTLFNSQVASFKILQTQDFLIREAPQINNTLNRIIPRANFFRMYPTLEDAKAGSNSVITDGRVMALKFQDPATPTDSSFGVIAYDADEKDLNYYHVSSMAELAVASPAWNISSQLEGAVFYVENGVLRTKLTGPNGEEIIYSSTTQR
jgi:prepilin-type N-terminal cleavage/methylation domain-containing protein